MPITVRYGPTGQLMQAAAQTGQAAGEQQAAARDAQLVQQVQQRYAQEEQARRQADQQQFSRRMQMVQEQRKQELQQAKLAQQARAARQQPTQTGRKGAPLTEQIKERLAQGRDPRQQQAAGGFGAVRGPGGETTVTAGGETTTQPDADRAAALGQAPGLPDEMTQAAEGLDPEQGRGSFVQGERADTQPQATPLQRAKAAFMTLQDPNAGEQARQVAQQELVRNPDVSFSDVQQVQQTQREQGEPAVSPGQRASWRMNQLRSQQATVEQEVESLKEQFTPTEQDMTQAEFEEHTQSQLDTQSVFNPMDWADDPVYTTQSEVDQKIEQFKDFKEKQKQLGTTKGRITDMVQGEDANNIDQEIPQGATIVRNPQTGQRLYSTDDGETWYDTRTHEKVQR